MVGTLLSGIRKIELVALDRDSAINPHRDIAVNMNTRGGLLCAKPENEGQQLCGVSCTMSDVSKSYT